MALGATGFESVRRECWFEPRLIGVSLFACSGIESTRVQAVQVKVDWHVFFCEFSENSPCQRTTIRRSSSQRLIGVSFLQVL